MSSPLVSYGQNHEDVVLLRALADRERGFYLDVGAGHPVRESVTKLFYERDWSGVNVEPHRSAYESLCRERERDVNLNVGVADRAGVLRYFESVSHPGASTFVAQIAAALPFDELVLEERLVEVTTLEAICVEHVPDDTEIDFLKIDAEGFEERIVESQDWERWRPRVLVVEAVKPHSTEPSHTPWERTLLAARYRFALFDGVNRFYVRAEDSHRHSALTIPANVNDGFVPYRFHRAIRDLEDALEAQQDRSSSLEEQLSMQAAERVGLEKRLRDQVLAEIGVVIVHHRGRELLARCLRSLLDSEGVRLQVVVVANSCPEDLSGIAGDDPRVTVVSAREPLGFSAANNLGVRRLEGQPGIQAFLFLNNDTRVEPESVAALADSLRLDPSCGLVGPRLMIDGAPGTLNSLGLNLTTHGEAWDEGIGRSLDEYGELPGFESRVAITGSALMVRASTFLQVGGWTELYDYYDEDLDLCIKASSLGWGVKIQPEAVVHHSVSATAGQLEDDWKTSMMWRNRFLLMLARWPASLLLRTAPRIAAHEIAIYLRRRLAGAHSDARRQARAWRGAAKRAGSAIRERRRLSPNRTWVAGLRRPGSVPEICLPPREVEPARGDGTR